MIRVLSIEQATIKVSSAAMTQPTQNLRTKPRQAEPEQVKVKKEPEEEVRFIFIYIIVY